MAGVDINALDWTTARAAAERIARQCGDAAYTAPEATNIHNRRLRVIAQQLNIIASALQITPPKESP